MIKEKLMSGLAAAERFFKSKAPPLIGCDISSSSVKLVEIAEAGKNLYRVERYVIEPLPRDSVEYRRMLASHTGQGICSSSFGSDQLSPPSLLTANARLPCPR